MKSINLIPDGSNGYISQKVFNLNGHHFNICTSVDGSSPFICTSVDDADENLEANEIFEVCDRLFQIDAESKLGRLIDEPKAYRRDAINMVKASSVFYVGTPTPSGHDITYIKVTKKSMLQMMRGTELCEWDKSDSLNTGTHYWMGQDGKTFYWN